MNATLKSRHTRRALATRGKLLEAARTLFTERGFELTSIDDITRRADVGKGTFYYHFTDREEIIKALIEWVIGELLAVIDNTCREATDLKTTLEGLIEAHIKFFSNRWEDFVLFFQGRTELTIELSYDGIETPFLKYLERVEELLVPFLQRRLPPPIMRRIACAVVGLVSGYYSFAAIESLDDGIDATFASLREAMVASMMRFVQEASTTTENRSQEKEAGQ
ncbi:MAG: TetR/AcrR family transcriptional regulator [PVC group bacterium]